MLLNLGSSGTPTELYTETGIVSGTRVQLQPRETHEIRVFCGDTAPTDYDECFVLEDEEWAEFESTNIWLWSSRNNAEVVVTEDLGRLFRFGSVTGTVAAIADVPGLTTALAARLPDQEYNAESALPQSGTAVAEAIADAEIEQSQVTGLEGALASLSTDYNSLNLQEILASKAITAVDAIIYDTSKDSDGGAWRFRCQHTSYYNEPLNTATRGARKDFPSVAVIIAEAAKVTIYDADDPTLPMWMVFTQAAAVGEGVDQLWRVTRNATSVSALNGVLSFGLSLDTISGVVIANFASDTTRRHDGFITSCGVYGRIYERNSAINKMTRFASSASLIVSGIVNSVAMTVLPDAPIDHATGLPVPTIAVATAGGVSVIKHDGSVTDSATTIAVARVAFDNHGGVWAVRNIGSYQTVYGSKEDYMSGDGWGDLVAVSNPDSIPAGGFLQITSGITGISLNDNTFMSAGFGGTSGASSNGLGYYYLNQSDLAKSMAAKITSTYNTGWMVGAIKGAWLSDTTTGDLVGSTLLDEDFTSYADTAAVVAAGWDKRAATFGTVTLVSGELQFARDAVEAGLSTGVSKNITGFVVGQSYVIKADIRLVSGSGGVVAALSTADGGGGSDYVTSSTTSTSPTELVMNWTATTTSAYFVARVSTIGSVLGVDNVSVKLATPDRSVNKKGLIVNGTLTRTPVATGSDLVAYGGFSESNYLEQPYNSALDFGTGDFSISAWWWDDSAIGSFSVFTRNTGTGTGSNYGDNSITLFGNVGTVKLRLGDSGILNFSSTLNTMRWRHVVALRRSGVLELWVDGRLSASLGSSTHNLTSVGAVVRLGQYYYNEVWTAIPSPVSLVKASATAPSADQIRKMYRDEKKLFEPNAQCTLYGTSDAVTAIAHDDGTNLLHVGTSSGRSDFDGLVRVGNTETAVTTCIDASNGMIVSQ